jgi:hypothetical protein
MSLHEHRHNWRALLLYGFVSVLVLGAGILVLLSFFERQRLRTGVKAEPLPKITLLASDGSSRLAAAWVSILTANGFKATLVSFDQFTPAPDDLLAICSADPLPPRVDAAVVARIGQGKGVVLLGAAPPGFSLHSDQLLSTGVIRIGQAVSPVLARVEPEHEIGARSAPVQVIEETPQMVVDARWKESARAAIAHWRSGSSRFLWFGLDPGALYFPEDRQLALLLRTSFRWVAGQPVSEGASGSLTAAKAMEAAARVDARRRKLAFSVDRLASSKSLVLRLSNKGNVSIENATVRVWLPAGAKGCRVVRRFWRDRDALLSTANEENAVIVTLPRLKKNESRLLELLTFP